eukprot:TRINITY_DN28667_c0_g1_i1.p3 TRINITY_DN28667_c0_g1~~TRINITY_DN28667_c0_g1_i1.p3  ORF type:complete len:111 (-),score=29.97 TRINITY_DN28667_c0_g1_i1:23-331(-)
MLAHVRYSAFDDIPASFSRKWIRGLLRSQYKYNGAVFCDDLCMKGAVVIGDIVERARVAIASGCDMLPVCNDRSEVVKLLEALPVKERRLSSARLKALYRTV